MSAPPQTENPGAERIPGRANANEPQQPDMSGREGEQGPDGPTFPNFNEMSIEDILMKYAGQVMTPELLQQFATDLAALEMHGQFQEQEYKQSYLDYLENQLGFNQAQLDMAQQQLDFQQGPYWEWYTGPYFEQMKKQSENQLAISDNNVSIAESNAESAGYGAESSRYRARGDQFGALGQFYGAQQAAYNLQERMAQDPRNIRASQFRMGVPAPNPRFGY